MTKGLDEVALMERMERPLSGQSKLSTGKRGEGIASPDSLETFDVFSRVWNPL